MNIIKMSKNELLNKSQLIELINSSIKLQTITDEIAKNYIFKIYSKNPPITSPTTSAAAQPKPIPNPCFIY